MSAAGPWLHVIGLGADGIDGLRPEARAALESAEVILGGARHHALTAACAAEERLTWPRPFDPMIGPLRARRGRRAAALVTGDPLWRSAGARLAAAFGPEEVRVHPQVSAYQWAAARMGWPLETVTTLTAHGRAAGDLAAHLHPGARLAVLCADAQTPAAAARALIAAGFGASRLAALSDLGAGAEARLDGDAAAFAEERLRPSSDLVTLMIACATGADAPPATPRGPGLPDAAFAHDGKMTKQEARAVALAKLWPRPGALLWDVGAGAGSVAVEWMRAAPSARALALEPDAERRARAADNARRLGVSGLEIIAGRAPEALAGLAAPDAVFLGGGLGGGLGVETAEAALAALRPQGRLVAHAVTLEAQALLMALAARHGGELTQIAVSRAEPVGAFRGWRPLMPITQWSLARGGAAGGGADGADGAGG